MACWSVPGAVEFESADGVKVTRAVPTDFLRYLDADGNGSDVVAIGVGADNHAYLVGPHLDVALDLGIASGNFAVAVLWNGASFIPVIVNSPTTYTIGGAQKQIPSSVGDNGKTSQGIRQLLADVIIWGDDTHVREVSGRKIHKFSHIGPVFAGQRDGPDHIDLFDGVWHTPIIGSAQPPKLTALHDGAIGVCAATNHGAVFAIGPPWPELIGDTPPPVDPPEPPPVEPDMDFPRAEWAIVEEMHARFADLFPATEHGARDWTSMTIEQLAFSFPGGGWCWKKSTPTNPPSKDCIARQLEGRFDGWDVLAGAGVTGPRTLAPYPPGYHDLRAEGNQVPIPVIQRNHLGATPPPHEPPNGTVEARLASLEEELTKLREDITRMGHQLAVVTGTADSALSEAVRAHTRIDGQEGGVDADLRKRFYVLVGKLREVKSTSRAFGHSHSYRVFEGDL